jgi:hypothetical protein
MLGGFTPVRPHRSIDATHSLQRAVARDPQVTHSGRMRSSASPAMLPLTSPRGCWGASLACGPTDHPAVGPTHSVGLLCLTDHLGSNINYEAIHRCLH